jgi:hypothetical protein
MDCMIRTGQTGRSTRGKSRLFSMVAVAGLLLAGANARAACGSFAQATTGKAHPASWDLQSGRAHLTYVEEGLNPIVGLWHVTFTAKGNGSGGPPDGAPIDNAIVTWHNDRTEIMNSDRPAQDGQFCMGVWEEVGKCQYKLNHFAWAGNDTTNAPDGIGKLAGPSHIVEEVTLNPDGKHFTGTFTLDAYDSSNNLATHIVGVIAGTRITTSTTVDDLL